MTSKTSHSILIAAFVWMGSLYSGAWGCSVPVFRYALEQWPAAIYRVEVFHKGELSEEAEKAGKVLEEFLEDEEMPLRLIMRYVDLEETPREGVDVGEGEARMDVYFPMMSQITSTAWSAPFTEESVRTMAHSPLRAEIAKKLVGGDSAVWIFMPCGDKEKDDPAEKILRDHLEEMENNLQLPEDEYDPTAPVFAIESNEQLRVSFPVVKLDRDDPKEAFLVSSLLHSEPDLLEYDEPIAFPVFGQGRRLFAVPGKDINERVIEYASLFLIGPCSCQVKDLNPGVDLLVRADWTVSPEDLVYAELELPPLSGIADIAENQETSQTVLAEARDLLKPELLNLSDETSATEKAAVEEPSAGIVLNDTLLVTLGAVLAFVGMITLIMRRTKI